MDSTDLLCKSTVGTLEKKSHFFSILASPKWRKFYILVRKFLISEPRVASLLSEILFHTSCEINFTQKWGRSGLASRGIKMAFFNADWLRVRVGVKFLSFCQVFDKTWQTLCNCGYVSTCLATSSGEHARSCIFSPRGAWRVYTSNAPLTFGQKSKAFLA